MNLLKSGGLLAIVSLLQGATLASSKESEMTVSIDPGMEECFYLTLKFGQSVDAEYQVIDGGQGELDINFNMWAPSGHLIVSDYKKSENNHRHTAQEDGDHKFCWDNSFSSYNSKTVFFELLLESENDHEEWNWDEDIGLTPEDVYEIKVQDIQDVMSRVHSQLSKVRHLQDQLRAHEARDRNIAESNFSRVNSWSMIYIALLIFVGLIQVVMVRSLFDDTSRVHKIWKKGNLRDGVSSFLPFD